jgi:hypothetical protein
MFIKLYMIKARRCQIVVSKYCHLQYIFIIKHKITELRRISEKINLYEKL